MSDRPIETLDMFSGIGAYSLGLERTGGFKTVGFCEIEDHPRRVLRRHWPDVPIFEDARELTGDGLRSRGIFPDWIVAGWPCQGNSVSGTGLGMDDPRSGLWSEIRRLAGELRPRGLLLENSSNLLAINDGRDFGTVLGNLASLGYDAEWHCLPAAAFDAPHIRDRVWIIATLPDTNERRCDHANQALRAGRHAPDVGRPVDAHADRKGLAFGAPNARGAGRTGKAVSGRAAERVDSVPHPSDDRRDACRPESERLPRGPIFDGDYSLTNIDRLAPIGAAIARQERVSWEPEPDVVRVVHGAPERVERIHALGNLNPPIIPEMIGRAILRARM